MTVANQSMTACDGRAMLWALNVAILAGAWAAQLDLSAKRDASPGWLESLRRQLMQDNYDYLPKSSESVETTSKTSTIFAMRRTPTTQYSSPKYSPPEYAPVKEDSDSGEHRPGTAGQDMVYYNMDEAMGYGNRRKIEVLDEERTVSKILQPVTSPEPMPNVTLKLIRLPGAARRGGGGPRFVAAAGARGVALVSVDGAPFPELRLPPAHRQYAHGHSYDLF